MADLPDFYSFVLTALTRAINLSSGLDVAKADSPTVGDVYVATDTTILYLCYEAGTWVNAGALYLLLAGGTMAGAIAMGANKITGLGAPTAVGDALRKGTRVTVTELPAMADEKYWVGTGGNVEERDVPTVGPTIASGSYTGDGTDDRDISVGVKCSMVIVISTSSSEQAIIIPNQVCHIDDGFPMTGGTALHATDGFTVFETNDDMNHTDRVYHYWAISE